MNARAQVGFYDAMLFMIIMFIASAGIYSATHYFLGKDEVDVRKLDAQFVLDLQSSLFHSTLVNITYVNASNKETLKEVDVETALKIDIAMRIRNEGKPEIEDIEEKIKAKLFVGCMGIYRFAFYVPYEKGVIFISDFLGSIEELETKVANKVSSVYDIYLEGKGISTTLYIWK